MQYHSALVSNIAEIRRQKRADLINGFFRPLKLEVSEGSEGSENSQKSIAPDDVALLLLRMFAQDPFHFGHVVGVVISRHLRRYPVENFNNLQFTV